MEGDAKTPTSPEGVPEETIRAIAREEGIRSRLRAELDAKPTESRIWKFLNSAFGLFLLSSVLVTGVGGFLTHMRQRALERAHNERVLVLLTEFDWRLNELEDMARRFNAAPDKEKGPLSLYIWRATVGDKAFNPTLREFRDVPFAGIVSQLRSLGFEDLSDEAFLAIKEIEFGETITIGPWPVYETGFLNQKFKILRQYRDRISARRRPSFWELL